MQPDDEPVEGPDEGPEERLSARDQWWFSPVLQVVAGAAVAAFQWGPISNGTAIWLNWVVAGAGLVVLGFGALAWFRAFRQR